MEFELMAGCKTIMLSNIMKCSGQKAVHSKDLRLGNIQVDIKKEES